jgi:hypothetical protein
LLAELLPVTIAFPTFDGLDLSYPLIFSRAKIQLEVGASSVEELLMIADRAAAHVKRPYLDHAELLYDERGCRLLITRARQRT